MKLEHVWKRSIYGTGDSSTNFLLVFCESGTSYYRFRTGTLVLLLLACFLCSLWIGYQLWIRYRLCIIYQLVWIRWTDFLFVCLLFVSCTLATLVSSSCPCIWKCISRPAWSPAPLSPCRSTTWTFWTQFYCTIQASACCNLMESWHQAMKLARRDLTPTIYTKFRHEYS